MERINILLSFDDNYMLPARVMMKSLSRFHSNISLYILHGGLKTENIEILKSEAESYGWIFNAVIVPEEIDKKLDNAPINMYFSKAMYYRLLCPWIINCVDKILYIDVDTYINGDLVELYNKCFERRLIAAVPDAFARYTNVKKNLNLSKEINYYNSGVQLIFLSKIRRCYTLENALDIIGGIIKKYTFWMPDQDILNKMYEGKIAELCVLYNFPAMGNVLNKLIHLGKFKKVKIVHFMGKIKPWNNKYCLFFTFKYYKILRLYITKKQRISYWIFKPFYFIGETFKLIGNKIVYIKYKNKNCK